jgi:hypothetical protein
MLNMLSFFLTSKICCHQYCYDLWQSCCPFHNGLPNKGLTSPPSKLSAAASGYSIAVVAVCLRLVCSGIYLAVGLHSGAVDHMLDNDEYCFVIGGGGIVVVTTCSSWCRYCRVVDEIICGRRGTRERLCRPPTTCGAVWWLKSLRQCLWSSPLTI